MIIMKNFLKKYKDIKILKNKTIIKWCQYNFIILILGISLILNIIYLPKYFNGTTNQHNHFTTIQINAINDKKVILPKTNYVTDAYSLGNLLSACPNTFEIQSTNFGRLLVGVNHIKPYDNKYWQVEYWNNTDKKFNDFPIGIDDIKLNKDIIIQLELAAAPKYTT